MKTELQTTAEGSVAEAALSASEVTFVYHGATVPALRSLSFEQRRGEMIGVMGASGAGKSTLAKCLNRLIPEFEGGEFRGIIVIGKTRLDSLRVCEAAAQVGMVFQDFEAQLFCTSVELEVAFAMEQVGMDRAEMKARLGPALEAVGLPGFEQRDPTSLSGGEKQRLAIASVLALRPSIIVLDEPTTDLDPEGKAEVFDLIAKLRGQGLSLIVIEHESEELLHADRIVLLRQGGIVADGPPAAVMTNFNLLEQCDVRLPGLNRVLHLLGIGAHVSDVDAAHEAIVRAFPKLRNSRPAAPAAMSSPKAGSDRGFAVAPLVEVVDLTFAYPGGAAVLQHIGLEIHAGEFLAIVGQNGSGKTTLAKHIVGLLQPTAGRVMLEGRDRATLHVAETAREVGYVFQNPDHQISAASVWDEVAFGPRNFGLDAEELDRRCLEVLDAVGLLDARDSDPFLLSKGERQRVAVASVLALRPRLLILDEPTTGLDHREQRRMMALVQELNRNGIAIVMITHTPWLVAEYAKRVVLMRKGRKLFDGAVEDFFAQDEILARSSFRAPPVTRLARKLGTLALTPQSLVDWVKEMA
ncbi:MAG: energy-coupling factor ABC transporter ATP-binding protein [Deltaproteobacteria bacterium]|nr:energy-coupling factor ABC transporter ATP-binding protein [Deltaproteobacteria bacterium]